MCYIRQHMVMKRTNYFYPAAMLARLKAISRKTGLPVAELIRRAIDEYLKRQKK
jgi:predicted DNA-binding protein